MPALTYSLRTPACVLWGSWYRIFLILLKHVKSVKVCDDCPGDLQFWHRHISKGSWTFSTRDQGWAVSDCTAEGLQVSAIFSSKAVEADSVDSQWLVWGWHLQAALALSRLPTEILGESIPSECIYNAVNIMLSYQVGITTVLLQKQFFGYSPTGWVAGLSENNFLNQAK